MGSSFFQNFPVDSATGQSVQDLVTQAEAALAAAEAAQAAAEAAQADAETAQAAAEAALASVPSTSTSPWKLSVNVATVSEIDVSASPATIDGVSLSVDDRILVKNQTTASQNGIYTYAGAGLALVRADDMNAVNEAPSGTTVYVQSGTANSQRYFTLTSTGTITPGSSAMVYADILSAGGSLAELPRPYDVSFGFNGNLLASEAQSFTAVRPFVIAANFGGSRASASVAPNAGTTLTLRKNAATIGTLLFLSGETSGTFTPDSSVQDDTIAFAAGDQLTVVAPDPTNSIEGVVITVFAYVES